MLKKTITYKDFNDEEVTEDFFFHLSQAELVELELSHDGGLSEAMKKIIDAEDGRAIVAEFRKILLMAYGKRSEDGKRFIKKQEWRDEFESSEAYSALFMEMVTDADAAAEFVNGMVPHNLAETVEAARLQARKEPPIKMTTKQLRELPAGEYSALSERIVRGEVEVVDDIEV